MRGFLISMVSAILLLIIISYGGIRYYAPKPVITSNIGNISQPTLAYLRFVEYSEQSSEQIFENFQNSMASGYLADQLGLRDDPFYEKFLAISRRARKQRAAIQWIKHNTGTMDVDLKAAFKQYAIESDVKKAIDNIVPCIQREQHGFRLKCSDVVVGQFNNRPLTLSMIHPLMTANEWQQFLSFLPGPMETAYKNYLRRFLYHSIHEKVVDHFNPVLDELEQMDHYQVAKRYIAVKYGMAHEGIYPTGRLSLDFPDTVLFNHFFAIKDRFLPVKHVQVQYSVFENMDMANMVHQKLREGEKLIDLAMQYAIHDYFVQTAYPHQLSGYGVDGMPSHPEKRPIIDNFLLDAARNNQLLPNPHPLDQGVLVAKLSDLKRQNLQLKYREYQFAVRRDLTLKVLSKKYRVDLEDALELINWQRICEESRTISLENRMEPM